MNNTGVSHSNDYCSADLSFDYSDRITEAINLLDITTGRTTVERFLEYDKTRRNVNVQCPLLIDDSSMDGKLWI